MAVTSNSPDNIEELQATDRKAGPARRRLQRALEGSSAAGLSRAISATSRTVRLLWTLLFVLGFCGLCVNVEVLIRRFVRAPVLTQTFPNREPFRWPDVTICDQNNPIPFTRHPELSMKLKPYIWNMSRLFRFVGAVPKYEISKIFILSSVNYIDFRINSIAMHEKSYFVPPNRDWRISKVELQTVKFYSRCQDMLATFNCFTIPLSLALNGADTKSIIVHLSINPTDHALLEWNLNTSDHLDTHHITDSGLDVRIVPANATLFTASDQFRITPGLTANFHMSMTRIRRVESSQCRLQNFPVALFDNTWTTMHRFKGSVDDCREFLLQEYIVEYCGCYAPFINIHKTEQVPPRLCFNMTLYTPIQLVKNIKCLMRAKKVLGDRPKFYSRCETLHKPLCDEVVYNVKKDNHHWSDIHVPSMKRHNIAARVNWSQRAAKAKSVRMTKLKLVFVRDSTNGTLIQEEYEYSFSQLLSDIGGLIGLWLGLSVVSLFELLEILWLFLSFLVKRRQDAHLKRST